MLRWDWRRKFFKIIAEGAEYSNKRGLFLRGHFSNGVADSGGVGLLMSQA
jgi:hypothetical protein